MLLCFPFPLIALFSIRFLFLGVSSLATSCTFLIPSRACTSPSSSSERKRDFLLLNLQFCHLIPFQLPGFRPPRITSGFPVRILGFELPRPPSALPYGLRIVSSVSVRQLPELVLDSQLPRFPLRLFDLHDLLSASAWAFFPARTHFPGRVLDFRKLLAYPYGRFSREDAGSDQDPLVSGRATFPHGFGVSCSSFIPRTGWVTVRAELPYENIVRTVSSNSNAFQSPHGSFPARYLNLHGFAHFREVLSPARTWTGL